MAFTLRQKVLFKHCDPAGIVFYPRYFEMINDTVETFFDQRLRVPFEDLHRGGAVPTAQIETTFHAPSRHGDLLDITLICKRLGRSSLKLEFVALSQDQQRFTATSTLVYVGTDGRPLGWPDQLRDRLTHELGVTS
jgi:4-hydroxybenzoyl-CoA thioesterase